MRHYYPTPSPTSYRISIYSNTSDVMSEPGQRHASASRTRQPSETKKIKPGVILRAILEDKVDDALACLYILDISVFSASSKWDVEIAGEEYRDLNILMTIIRKIGSINDESLRSRFTSLLRIIFNNFWNECYPIIDNKDNKDQTALLQAVTLGLPDVVKILIENGADVRITDSQGSTPLEIARRMGYDQVANVINRATNDSQLICRAEYLGQVKIVFSLLEKGRGLPLDHKSFIINAANSGIPNRLQIANFYIARLAMKEESFKAMLESSGVLRNKNVCRNLNREIRVFLAITAAGLQLSEQEASAIKATSKKKKGSKENGIIESYIQELEELRQAYITKYGEEKAEAITTILQYFALNQEQYEEIKKSLPGDIINTPLETIIESICQDFPRQESEWQNEEKIAISRLLNEKIKTINALMQQEVHSSASEERKETFFEEVVSQEESLSPTISSHASGDDPHDITLEKTPIEIGSKRTLSNLSFQDLCNEEERDAALILARLYDVKDAGWEEEQIPMSMPTPQPQPKKTRRLNEEGQKAMGEGR